MSEVLRNAKIALLVEERLDVGKNKSKWKGWWGAGRGSSHTLPIKDAGFLAFRWTKQQPPESLYSLLWDMDRENSSGVAVIMLFWIIVFSISCGFFLWDTSRLEDLRQIAKLL